MFVANELHPCAVTPTSKLEATDMDVSPNVDNHDNDS